MKRMVRFVCSAMLMVAPFVSSPRTNPSAAAGEDIRGVRTRPIAKYLKPFKWFTPFSPVLSTLH
jgi:hypothetical protein